MTVSRAPAVALIALLLAGCASMQMPSMPSWGKRTTTAKATPAGSAAPPTQRATCDAASMGALTALAAGVKITSAAMRPAGPVEGGGGGPPGAAPATAPAHCEVLGRMQERQGANGQAYAIKFHLRLPAEWNGRFFFQGGGGSNGVVGSALGNLMGAQGGNALSLGYAVISQDSGHDNAVNNDPKRQGVVTFGWDALARRNYGGYSIGPVTTAGKTLVAAFYGKAPQFTYYVGGSKGGQEAMMAAERFPEMFDAVLAGYPGFRLADAGAVGQMWDAQAFAAAAKALGQTDFNGQPMINRAMSDDDLLLVSGAVLKACDMLDGTADGMVEDFAECTTEKVSPALAAITCKTDDDKQFNCLAPSQVAALKKVFDGAKAADGRQLYASWPWDAGIAVKAGRGVSAGWRQWKMGGFASPVNNGLAVTLGGASASAVFTSPPTAVADDPAALTTYTLGVDVTANYAAARVKWGEFNDSSVDFMNADATDLSAFSRRGGKMLIYHGVSDPVFSINDTIAWWKAVDAREAGTAARFVRLFAVPGMNHGAGGAATEQFDAFGALVAWREKGEAPASLKATALPGSPWPGRTRLLCPYPQQPRRTAAEMEHAESFQCFAPPPTAAPAAATPPPASAAR